LSDGRAGAPAPPIALPDPLVLERTASLLQVVAHPVRLLVLCVLEREGALSAGDLQDRVGIEASALSHHLRLLRDARLVRVQPQGRHRIYTLDDPHVAAIVRDAIDHVGEV
jgi:DNA-binding transcriptional ArsR family regulator